MPPVISVIIPTYNRKHLLSRALNSVLMQTEVDYEILVVDDGSTDETSAWLRSAYSQVYCIRLPLNQGVATARNVGIRQARGSLIAFLDSDDEWLPQYLQVQRQAIAHHPEAVLSYCNYLEMIPGRIDGEPVHLQPVYSDLVLSMLFSTFIHTFSQVVVPAWVFSKVGLLNEQLKVCEDREFYLRALALGSPVHIPELLVRKYWLPGSLVTQSDCQTWLSNGLHLLEIFFKRPENARYLPICQQAEAALRHRVTQSQQQFAQVLDQELANSEK